MANADANKPNKRIFLSLAAVTEVEEQAVIHALHSGWAAPLGSEVDAFETEIAKRHGVDHTPALSSDTVDLYLTLFALGIGEGGYIPVSTMIFATTTDATACIGATSVFVGAMEDGNINPKLLLHIVNELLAEGKNIPGVVIVDFSGRYVDYPIFTPRLEEFGIVLIEDAAEALGASVNGQPAGGFGHTAALSLNGNKIMTTSDGDILLSSDVNLIARARCLSMQARQPVVWYEHAEISYNYRPFNLFATLGRTQHSRLDGMIARRRQTRDTYIDLFASFDDDASGKGTRLLPDSNECSTENYRLTSIMLPQETVDKGVLSPDGVIAALGEVNIEARHLRKPIHLQPVYEGARASINGTAESLFSHGVTLPSGSALDDDDAARMIGVLKEVLG